MSEAVSASQTLLARGAGSPPAYTTVPELFGDITFPTLDRNEAETSTHNDGAESYIMGIVRTGAAAITVNWLPNNASHQAVFADYEDKVTSSWRYTLPSGTTITCDAKVKSFNLQPAGLDGVQRLVFTLRFNGMPVIVPAA